MTCSSVRRLSCIPRLEVMEARDCASCTVTFRDGMLSIVGDSSANQVAILNSWSGTQVRCDQQEPRVFVGVTAIDVQTLDGNDRVGFFSNAIDRRMPTLAVDLGGGDDLFAASADVPPGPCVVAINGGGGNDALMAN